MSNETFLTNPLAGIFLGILCVAGMSLQTAQAGCPVDKEEITVVNRAGKVITLCVAPAAISNLSGGAGEVIIAGSCPCFSQEDIDAAFAVDPSITCSVVTGIEESSGKICQRAECSSSSFRFQAHEETAGDECVFDIPQEVARSVDSWCENNNGEFPISEEDATACVTIIKTFIP